MNSRRRGFHIGAMMGLLLAAGAGLALAGDNLVLRGGSVKVGDSQRMSSNTVKLDREASIEKIEGTSESFCVYSGKQAVVCSDPQHGAIGRRLGPGVYRLYVLVPEGRDEAYVFLYLRYVDSASR